MNNDQSQAVVAATAVSAVIVAAAYNYVKTVKTERAKRREIEKNLQLDLIAIKLAKRAVTTKLEVGYYDGWSVTQMLDNLNNEIEFQKTVVRES